MLTLLDYTQLKTLSHIAGNYVCLLADAANHWVTIGYSGTLTAGS